MKELIEYIKKNWGVEKTFLENKKIIRTGEYKYRLISQETPKKLIGEVAGTYFARKNKDGTFRLSIEGSQIIGPLATKNVIEINKEELWQWIRGINLENNHDHEGWVILKHGEDYVGCGKACSKGIINHVPKNRRIKNL